MDEEFRDFTNEVKKNAEQAVRQDAARYANIRTGESVGAALLDGMHQDLRDAAEALTRIASYFSPVDYAAPSEGQADELDSELNDYMRGSFGFSEYKSKMYQTAKLIEELVPAVQKYTSYDTKVNGVQKDRIVRLEADDYNRVKTVLDKCMGNLDDCLLYEESDSVMFRNLYSQVANTAILLEDMSDGHLIKPMKDQKTDENGKSIFQITLHDDGLLIYSDRISKTTAKLSKEHNWTLPLSSSFYSAADIPLFPHEPNEEDLSQGGIGDCYMMAGLSAIAKSDPARIKDAIRDNRDGTVTVRFFNEDNNALYITVDKTIPYVDYMGDAPFSRGALWVKMIEKAYAASGIADNPERTLQLRGRSYNDIESGSSSKFMGAILGRDIKVEDSEVSQDPIFSRTTGSNYNSYEQREFNFIQNAVHSNKIVTASTRSKEDFQRIAMVKVDPFRDTKETATEDGSVDSFFGVFRTHAYTVTGVTEDHGLKYVILRNPHNSGGYTLDENGELQHRDSAQGEVYVELRNFRMLFHKVGVASTEFPAMDRSRIPEARNFMNAYGTKLLELTDAVKKTENIFGWKFRDSDEFHGLAEAAEKLAVALKAEPPAMSVIDRHFKAFLEGAEAYKNYRMTPAKNAKEARRRRKNEVKERSINRLEAVNQILELAAVYGQEEAQKAERANAPVQNLNEPVAQPGNQTENVAGHRITMDELRQKVQERKDRVFGEFATEDLSLIQRSEFQKTADSLKNFYFKELRNILCEQNKEEMESINAALLEARAFLRAGHSAEELRSTALAENTRIAPYFNLIAEAVEADEREREDDIYAAQQLLDQTSPEKIGPEAEEEETLSPEVAFELGRAQNVIDDTLKVCNLEKEIDGKMKKWSADDDEFGLPSYHLTENNDRLSAAFHVKNEDRAKRREYSANAAELLAQIKGEYEVTKNITKAMVYRSGMDKETVDKTLEYIDSHDDLFKSVLNLDVSPRNAMRNLEIATVLATGSEEEKGKVLKNRMAELVELQNNRQIGNDYSNPDSVLQQMSEHYRPMNAITNMMGYLATSEGQHSGVTLDEIEDFNNQVQEKFDVYKHNVTELTHMADPVYQYIDRRAAYNRLAEVGNDFAVKLKKCMDDIQAKQNEPNSKAKTLQIYALQIEEKKCIAGMVAVVQKANEAYQTKIDNLSKNERKLTDYSIAEAQADVYNSRGFQLLIANLKPNDFIKEEAGKTKYVYKEAKTLNSMMKSFKKMEEMNTQLEQDSKYTNPDAAPAQPNA